MGYQAVGTFSDGSSQNISNAVTWSSSATNVVTIGAAGQATGQSAGAALITAQLGSIGNTANVVVESAALTAINITPLSASIPNQMTTQLTAVGVFGDGSSLDLTNSVTWTSSPASVATINDSQSGRGLATAMSPGSSTVTAAFGGVVGTGSLTVTDATLTSITVTPESGSIAVGSSQQFSAAGHFSDGTNLNLTNRVAWTSSSVSTAVINTSGLASGLASGTTTITAAMSGATVNAVLTVQ